MNEFISRDEAYQQLHDAGGCGATDEWSKGYDEAIGVAIGIIEDTPSADVAPVVHGHWKYVDDDVYTCYKCSACGSTLAGDKSRYCPGCGAKKDESEGTGNE